MLGDILWYVQLLTDDLLLSLSDIQRRKETEDYKKPPIVKRIRTHFNEKTKRKLSKFKRTYINLIGEVLQKGQVRSTRSRRAYVQMLTFYVRKS